jgi:hypothetical protein
MTNLTKIAKSIAVKTNRSSIDNYLSMGDKLASELTASALSPKKEEILSNITFLEDDLRHYSALVQQDSGLVVVLPFICIPIVVIVREYDIHNQNLYYGLMTGILLTIAIRVFLNIRRQSITFYALGSLTQLANK